MIFITCTFVTSSLLLRDLQKRLIVKYMEYSEIVTLTKDGFQIPEKLLHPVGVYDGSRCWGTHITNIGSDIGCRPYRSVNQILLSPIPFNSWACTVRILARIQDQPGKLKSLIEVLALQDLCTNIISISENTSGYYNGRANVLVELYDLRDEARSILRINIKDKEKRKKITSYSIRVLKRILEIQKRIIEADKIENFLYHSDKLTGGSYLWTEEELNKQITAENDKNQLLQLFDSYSVRSLSCQWLRTQAMCYLYSLEEQPIRFDYSLSEKLLKSPIDAESNARGIAQSFSIDLPAIFLGTFHPMSKYIRLVSLQDDQHRKPLVKIAYKYNCNSNSKDKDISKNGSNGLLLYLTKNLAGKEVCRNLVEVNNDDQHRSKNFQFNIKNVISYSKRFSRKSESGAIEIFGYCEGISNQCLDNVTREITSRIKGFEKNTNSTIRFNKTINVSFENPYRIFLSCREEIKKDKTFRSIYERVAKKYGVRIELSDESAEIVTADVLNRVSSVDALIVIFSLTEMEHQEYMQASDKNKYTPNLGWLLFELGIGMGKKIPTVQIRDITVVTKAQWSHWVNVGKDASLSFIDRKKPDEMEAHMENAIRVILEKLSSRSCLSK
jgi:hypothetical protein